MNRISHGEFTSVFHKEMRSNLEANKNQEVLILGAIQLYWEHNKNIAYLNNAMQYARGRRGIRVKAVRAFLAHFTGAVFKQGSDFVKAGRKVKEMPEGFEMLSSWLDWADEHAPEPEYDVAKQQLKVISFLQHQKKIAVEHGEDKMAETITASMIAYGEAEKKVVEAK